MLTDLNAGLNREMERCMEYLTVHIPAALRQDQNPADYVGIVSYEDDIKRRIRYLRRVMAELPRLPLDLLFLDRIGFGSVVRVEDSETGAELTYTMMVGDAIQLAAGEISLASPLGQSLLGLGAGSEVEVTAPGGLRKLRVVSVTTLFDQVDMEAGTTATSGSRELLDALRAVA